MHTCPCCGYIEYSDEVICTECHLAGCEYTQDSVGEWGWWNCQAYDPDDEWWE